MASAVKPGMVAEMTTWQPAARSAPMAGPTCWLVVVYVCFAATGPRTCSTPASESRPKSSFCPKWQTFAPGNSRLT